VSSTAEEQRLRDLTRLRRVRDRDTLGCGVRDDVGYEGMRRITVGPAGQPGTSIVLLQEPTDPSGNLICIDEVR
jgi:hypothetical protein